MAQDDNFAAVCLGMPRFASAMPIPRPRYFPSFYYVNPARLVASLLWYSWNNDCDIYYIILYYIILYYILLYSIIIYHLMDKSLAFVAVHLFWKE